MFVLFFSKWDVVNELRHLHMSLPTQSLAENEHSAQAKYFGTVLSESLHSPVKVLKANPRQYWSAVHIDWQAVWVVGMTLLYVADDTRLAAYTVYVETPQVCLVTG